MRFRPYPGITIATIDSGIDLKNADITGHVSKASWNFINNSGDVTDDNGHGTFVASEMVAANNGVGLVGKLFSFAYDAVGTRSRLASALYAWLSCCCAFGLYCGCSSLACWDIRLSFACAGDETIEFRDS